MKRGACVLLSIIVASCLFPTERVSALTRDDVMATAEAFRVLTDDVDSANVYPWNQSGCYTSSCQNTVPLGSNTGMAYSWGNWHTTDDFPSCLEEGRGAGNGSCMDYSCYHGSMCGIDCSGLVGRAWGITSSKPGTWTLVDLSAEVDTADLEKGDILDKPGSHVMIFDHWTSFPSARIVHSAKPPGHVTEDTVNVNLKLQYGYVPRVYNEIKDEPVAALLWIGSDSSGTVAWETGWEEETEGFVVCRAVPDGSWEAISDLPPAEGSAEKGASYVFRDPACPGPRAVYRLREVETTGRRLWLARTSAADGIPSPPRTVPHARRTARVGETGPSRGAGNCVVMNPNNPENQNLEWIAVCPSEWEDELAPQVG